jgi:hypothetical protein
MRNNLNARFLATAILVFFCGCNKTSTSTPATGSSNTGNPASSSVQTAQAPPEAPPVVIDAGTSLTVTIDQAVSTNTNNSGDSFAASLAEPVEVNGKEVLPTGAKVGGTVTQANSAGRIKGGAVLALTLDSITVHGKRYSVETSTYERTVKARGKRTAEGAGGGAALGAIVGALAGGGKGAAIGALAGGGAGTAATALTGKREVTIPAETRVHFKLHRPVTISQ